MIPGSFAYHRPTSVGEAIGLLADLGHICETSGVAATIYLPRVPLSAAAREAVGGDPAMHAALVTGGDDYELLFTAPPEADDEITGLSRGFGLAITEIGQIAAGAAAVRLEDQDGREIPVGAAGWRHF